MGTIEIGFPGLMISPPFNKVWYELEIVELENQEFYKTEERDNSNAGYDLYANSDVDIYETCQFIPFGIKVRMLRVEENMRKELTKTDCHYWLTPRSSIYKYALIMANSVGVIDSSYRGEVKAPVWSMKGESHVHRGERLFQIVAPDMGWIRYVRKVESLPETSRGEGGFGSTGV